MAEIPTPDDSFSSPADSERPLGVTILAVLQIIGAIFMIIAGAGMLLIPILGWIVGPIILVIGLISFYIGKGLWDMEDWAWQWAIILNIISIILGIFSFDIVGIIISIIIIVYLNQPDIKSRFGR